MFLEIIIFFPREKLFLLFYFSIFIKLNALSKTAIFDFSETLSPTSCSKFNNHRFRHISVIQIHTVLLSFSINLWTSAKFPKLTLILRIISRFFHLFTYEIPLNSIEYNHELFKPLIKLGLFLKSKMYSSWFLMWFFINSFKNKAVILFTFWFP